MLSAWMGLLINSRAEMVAAVLRSVSVLLSHPDELYLETDHENIGAFTVFAAANGNISVFLLSISSTIDRFFPQLKLFYFSNGGHG